MEPSATQPALASSEQLLKSLVETGLMSAAEVRNAVRQVPVARRTDSRTLAQELVNRNVLTGFQATRLLGTNGRLVFGNYVLLEELGEGGMGVVFKARQRGLDRVVALKLLAPAANGKEGALKRFRREIQAAGRLNHPHIVRALDAGEDRGTHFFVMEYVKGCDLAQQIKEHGPLPVDRVVACTLQAARGLECAHAAGIVHRDIKPSNLLLDDAGTVKVLDLGLARFDRSGAQRGNETVLGDLTQTGSIMGTCDYMAPEQALNAKTADHRADIYSLGATLYFLLTGKPMYAGDTGMEKMFAHRENEIPPLPGAPKALEALFRRMVAKDPAKRFQSMAEVSEALQTCAQTPVRRRGVGLWKLAGGGVAAAAAVVVAALALSRGSDRPLPADPAAPANSPIGSVVPTAPVDREKWRAEPLRIRQVPASSAPYFVGEGGPGGGTGRPGMPAGEERLKEMRKKMEPLIRTTQLERNP